MKGMNEKTYSVFEKLSKTNCVKEYTLIGGTALAMQLEHRLSEDLDFVIWQNTTGDKPVVNFGLIQKELLNTGGTVVNTLIDGSQYNCIVDDVKVTFFADQLKSPTGLRKISSLNNICISDVNSLGIMKLYLIPIRRSHRDYYDVYVLLKNGYKLSELLRGVSICKFN
jgi:predicted nucleotidyltransferase component of viral defense system